MNHYITAKVVKELREKKKLTQLELANMIGVSDKTISKWETGRGLPDISLIEPLAKALDVSIIELLQGDYKTNHNISSNMLKSKFLVCPVCGNIIHTMGENMVSCCGVTLPVLEAEIDDSNTIACSVVENEYLVTMKHEMTKSNYISFVAYVTNDRCEIVKLYPEQNVEVRFMRRGRGKIYAYSNRNGLLEKKI